MRVCINLLTPGSICFYSKNVGSDLIIMTNENMDKEHMNDTNNISYVVIHARVNYLFSFMHNSKTILSIRSLLVHV